MDRLFAQRQWEQWRSAQPHFDQFAAGIEPMPIVNPTLAASEPRKIPLNHEAYCRFDCTEKKGNPACDHDFNPDPTWFSDVMATWKCTRCGREVTYGVWE